MKTESPAAYVGLLMLLFVAMAPSDAAYIDSADTEAVGDNNQVYSILTCWVRVPGTGNLVTWDSASEGRISWRFGLVVTRWLRST